MESTDCQTPLPTALRSLRCGTGLARTFASVFATAFAFAFAFSLDSSPGAQAAGAAASGGDWPTWRGPQRDGRSPETGLLKSWPESGPALAWQATGLGAGFSSVSVSGDLILTTGDKGGDNQVVALKRSDGKPLWSAKLGKSGAPGWGGFAGPRSTPTVDGDLVFAIGQFGEVACFETATGKEVWRKHLVEDFGGKLPEWGYSESVLADGANAVCTPGGPNGAIVALDKRTGKVAWRSKAFTDNAEYASLVPADFGGARQYIQLTQASVAGVAAADGALLWRAPRKGNVAVIPTPIFDNGLVYVSSSYGVGCNLFKVTAADGKFSAEQTYANKVMKNHHGGVVLLDGFVYGHSDETGWVCQDIKTGKAAWEEKGKLGKGSLAYADGMLVLREENKEKSQVALVEASPTGYHEKGRFLQPNRSGKEAWAHPVIAGGKLYLRDQDVLLCYDIKAKAKAQ